MHLRTTYIWMYKTKYFSYEKYLLNLPLMSNELISDAPGNVKYFLTMVVVDEIPRLDTSVIYLKQLFLFSHYLGGRRVISTSSLGQDEP